MFLQKCSVTTIVYITFARSIHVDEPGDDVYMKFVISL